MTRISAFLVLAVLTLSVNGQEDCIAQDGQCVDWTQNICYGGVVQGLCPGDEDIRCCLSCTGTCDDNQEDWSGADGDANYADEECVAKGGQCFDNTNYCDGVWDTDTSICGNSATDDLNRECCRPLQDGECPEIISREVWGARDPTSVTYLPPDRPYYFTHHSEGSECYSIDECSAVIRAIQDYHMDSNGWNDIGYNFLIGGDGRVYEGRGFDVQGAHTENFNDVGYGTCFIGDFMEVVPTSEAINTGIAFQNCCQSLGYVSTDYEMLGHRQTKDTDCPGDMLYLVIQTFPHWVNECIAPDGDCCC